MAAVAVALVVEHLVVVVTAVVRLYSKNESVVGPFAVPFVAAVARHPLVAVAPVGGHDLRSPPVN